MRWQMLALFAVVAVSGPIGPGAWMMIWGRGDHPNAIGSATVIDLERGRTAYAVQCASCHGSNLEGQANWRERRADGRLPAPPHDASGHTWRHSDAEFFELTKYGGEHLAGPGYRSDMPAFATRLADDDIRNVLAFIRSTWPAEIQRRPSEISRRHMAR